MMRMHSQTHAQANRTTFGAHAHLEIKHKELEEEVTTLRGQLATLSTLQQAIPAEREGQRERERDLQKRVDDLQLQVGRSQQKKGMPQKRGGRQCTDNLALARTEFLFSSLVNSTFVTRNV